MKRGLLPLVIATALPGTALAAGETDVTVYGKIYLTALTIEQEGKNNSGPNLTEDSTAELTSNASRLGFKGKTKINHGLHAIFKLEYEIAVDDGDLDGDEFQQRNIYGGLHGDFGTLIGGKHDSPLKLAQGKVDLFNDLVAGDFKQIFTGENRTNNIIMYTTPKMGNFSATLATVLGEDSTEITATGSVEEYDSFFDAISASATYKTNDFFVTLAIDQEIPSSLEVMRLVVDEGTPPAGILGDRDYSQRTDAIRLVGGVKLGDFQLNGLYQMAENSNVVAFGDFAGNDSEFDGLLLSGMYTSGPWSLKAQYAINEGDFKEVASTNKSDSENTQLIVGVDYKLAKKTKVFGYISALEFEYNESVSGNKDSSEENVVALGFEHKF